MDTSEYLGLFVEESRESLQALAAALLDLERDPGDAGTLAAALRIAHSLKGMSATMGFEAMAGLTHRMETVLVAQRDGAAAITAAAGDALFACLDTLEEMVDRIAAGDGRGVDAAPALARLDAIVDGAGSAAAAVAEVAATRAPAASGEAGRAVAGAPARPAAVPTVRVGTDRLDALADLVGELAVQRARLARLARREGTPGLRRAAEDLARVTGELESLAAQLRMTPVGAVFSRFPRMVRDLAATLGKRVRLEIRGEDTELDRAAVDALRDPLVHMLRNAVDHGLEPPREREAAGKDPVGTIRLSARRAGEGVLIEVRDDGRGMDPGALRRAAVRRGLMGAQAAAALSDDDATALLFLPGVSTAAATTEVSGRGVGMDAARAAVGALGGAVSVRSVAGEGSRFTIRLP